MYAIIMIHKNVCYRIFSRFLTEVEQFNTVLVNLSIQLLLFKYEILKNLFLF